MNDRIENCLYQAGLTAQGCWDELDDYAKKGIEKFGELIVQDCLGVLKKRYMGDNNREDMEVKRCIEDIKKHFGVE
jgi:hypothetical protein